MSNFQGQQWPTEFKKTTTRLSHCGLFSGRNSKLNLNADYNMYTVTFSLCFNLDPFCIIDMSHLRNLYIFLYFRSLVFFFFFYSLPLFPPSCLLYVYSSSPYVVIVSYIIFCCLVIVILPLFLLLIFLLLLPLQLSSVGI